MNEHPAVKAIREHNEGCDASCAAQRPGGDAQGCGYQNKDGTLRYGSRRCPYCPLDWKIAGILDQLDADLKAVE